MELERKAMQGDASMAVNSHFHGKITYIAGTKVICCLKGARIGIQYETPFSGLFRLCILRDPGLDFVLK
ncbi:hypothetical protein C5167_018893 [Papaver somniferum]|uniref:Uncharacterized protein n=1 Tax=Papaver somniferum TaxID=3469 RepID=A0A4Y7ISI0_PAPSO|nr:hypothetical protein C5167_018893 [Papaver somniferum]